MSATVHCSEQRKEPEEFINKIVESCMLNNAQSYFRRSRFMAYRMMVYWCWGFLGKELKSSFALMRCVCNKTEVSIRKWGLHRIKL
jgi:hypothetical protein